MAEIKVYHGSDCEVKITADKKKAGKLKFL